MFDLLPKEETYTIGNFVEMTEEQLLAKGVEQGTINAEKTRLAKVKATIHLRRNIETKAGDIPSLLGTTADGANLAVFMVCQLIVMLHATGTEETKAAIERMEVGDQSILPMITDFLSGIETKETILPILIKGIESVFADIALRSTRVSETLIEVSQKGGA